VLDRQFCQKKIVRLEASDELGLARQDKEQGRALRTDASSSANSVDVIGVGGGCIVLQNPVNLKGKVKKLEKNSRVES